jgi:LysM repeat protein/uncharacterized protein YkwD
VFSKILLRGFLLLVLLSAALQPAASARAERVVGLQSDVTAFDLIIAMNTLRMSYGLPALIEDPIINAVAQGTAEIMAANQSSWHIGNVSGRLQSAGYGGGAKVWATENFAVGNQSLDEIMVVWSDASHMIPAVNPAYCHVGAGTARSSNGMTYYVLQAAYTAGQSCGAYKPPDGFLPEPGRTPAPGTTGGLGLIYPVKIATPDEEGKIYHVVQGGQSFWSIAVAYKVTIKDIETWNNLSRDSKLQVGQRLFIPSASTTGYSTPTPVGMIQVSTPEVDGRVVHEVQPYQTLSTIAQAYGVAVQKILVLNGIQEDWPLQIGQKLLLAPSNITPSATPRPLTAVEKLTPQNDGKFYHVVQSGETLYWIAQYYELPVNELMAWNGLNNNSILQPEQKLLLRVTPPATASATPGPATITPSLTPVPPSATASLEPSQAAGLSVAPGTQVAAARQSGFSPGLVWTVLIGLGVFALALIGIYGRRRT